MADLLSILVALQRRAIRDADARRILATLGTPALHEHLRTAGLTGEIPLAPPQTLADILLYLNRAGAEKPRSPGPKSIPALIKGSLFEGDCEDVGYRFALRRSGGADIYVVRTGAGGSAHVEKEFVFRDEELDGAQAGVPREQAPPLPSEPPI